ncbi:MAG: peptidylprolyl isomerase [bacterium]|nr:peptidylprolyl isomerase [bacterium]
MRARAFAVLAVLLCLVGAACSSESNDDGVITAQNATSAPTGVATDEADPASDTNGATGSEGASAATGDVSGTSEPTDTNGTEQAGQSSEQGEDDEQGEQLVSQADLGSAVLTILSSDAGLPESITDSQIECLADSVALSLEPQRIAELAINEATLREAYNTGGSFLLGDRFGITGSEQDKLVNSATACADWRGVLTDTMTALAAPPEVASCYGEEVSTEGIGFLISGLFISAEGLLDGQTDSASEEISRLLRACFDLRDFLFDSLVAQQGISVESAQCVVDNMSDELVDAYLDLDPSNQEAAAPIFAELQDIQSRCFTEEELEQLNDATSSASSVAGDSFEMSVGSQPCPLEDGSGQQMLDFDGAQPMCLDTSKEYTAVFDTTAGEMRVVLDTESTPVTANNFAVLARYRYYDDTLLFRTDPSIGIIQGGSPHTNSPADPGPGYTIVDEGSGFTYEPGQIVMARSGAPNSASAQFFFAVNEDTVLLNGQGTYVVFGQMDAQSLEVAEAILASHADQPENPLGGAPNPPVTVNSVTITETG